MREKHLLVLAGVRHLRRARASSPTCRRCYLALGALHDALQADPGQVQGLHRDPEGERLPVAAHDAVRPVRHAARGRRSAPQDMHRVAEAGVASHWLYKTAPSSTRRACSSRRTAGCSSLLEIQTESRRLAGIPRAHQGRPLPRRGLRLHAEGQDHGAAARRDGGRLRLRRAHRHRQPLRRGARSTASSMPLRTELQQRRPRRDHHRDATRKPNPVWLLVRAHRQGALAHPPLPEDHAATRNRPRLGERLLDQALRDAEGRRSRTIDDARWDALLRDPAQDARGDPRRHRPRQAPRRRWSRGSCSNDRASPTDDGEERRTRSRSAAPRAWRCSSRRAAGRSRAMPIIGSIKKGQGLVVHAVRLHQHRALAQERARAVDRRRMGPAHRRGFSRSRSTSWSRTSAECSPRWPRRSPRRARTSTRSAMDEDRGALHHHALRARGGEPAAPRARHARAAAPAGRKENFPPAGIEPVSYSRPRPPSGRTFWCTFLVAKYGVVFREGGYGQ